MQRLSLFLFLLCCLAACQREGRYGTQEILLTENIHNLMNERGQVVYDTLNGEVVRSFRQIPGEENIAKLLNNDRVTIVFPAADVQLGEDTVRIGIMRVKEWDKDFARHDYSGFPDHLFITHAGTESTTFVLDQANIRPITRRTVFRVGRNHYLLRSVDSLLTRMVIEPIEPDHNIPLSAEFDPRYRRVSVRDLDNQPATINHTKGKNLAICFTGVHDWDKNGVTELDGLYWASTQVQSLWEVAFVNHSHSPKTLQQQVAHWGIALPVYKSAATTCSTLNCRPNLPYCVEVDPNGEVTTYFRPLSETIALIRQSAGPVPLPTPAASSSSRR